METVVALLCQLGAYAVFDILFRQGRLSKWCSLGGLLSGEVQCCLIGALALLLSPWITWESLRLDGFSRPVQFLSAGLCTLLVYNATTRDIDPTQQERRGWLRVLAVLTAAGAWASPICTFAVSFLLSVGFSFWLHHATFPMRALQAVLGFLFLRGLLSLPWLGHTASMSMEAALSGGFVAFLVMMQVSHYFITALAKMLLGPKWYSWVVDNQLHHLVASAYSWGWARFVPWKHYRHLIGGVKKVERPVQLFAFLMELSAPVALFHRQAAAGFSLAFSAFHVGVFCLSGLLFWDWIATDILLFVLLITSPQYVVEAAFAPTTALVACALMAVFPLRHKLWKPMPLGWFDTPLSARIHWEAVGKSGKVYQIYNDFMCPHERLYGRVNGCFFVPHPVVSYHLGEVWKPDLRKAILQAGPDPEKLALVRARFGIVPRDEDLQRRHLDFLRAFFFQLNSGANKHVLPSWLHFLKAPGDQIFYWGDRPAYRRQEPVRQVRLRFVEEYFDENDLVRLTDVEVARVDIPREAPDQPLPELTPKQLDLFLLEHAEGRLIDLPGRRKKYGQVLQEV